MGLVKALQNVFGLKSAKVHPGSGYYMWPASLHGERNYSMDVGSGEGSSLIQAVIGYYSRTSPEAPHQLINPGGDIVQSHPILDLLKFPNEGYSGVVLEMATMMSWICDGNAYWRVEFSDSGRPIALWYTPHWMIEPKWKPDGTDYVTYYEYNPGNSEPIKLKPWEVIHFRYGLDPHNTRKGYSWVKTLLRELYTDEEAARFVAAMLRNMGIVGIVISPKEQDDSLTEEEANAMKTLVKQRTTGDQRGDPIVSETPIDVIEMGKTSDKIDTSKLRAVPESRVAALSGLPAAVLGFLSGMEQTSVGATMSELRELAYESALIPSQRIMSADIQLQLLSHYVSNAEAWHMGRDYSRVRVLQSDMDKKWKRVVEGWTAGAIMLSEAREELGLIPGPNEDFFYQKSNFKYVRREDIGQEVEEPEPIVEPIPIRGTGTG